MASMPRDWKNSSPKPARSSVRLSVNESNVTTQQAEENPVRRRTRRSRLRNNSSLDGPDIP